MSYVLESIYTKTYQLAINYYIHVIMLGIFYLLIEQKIPCPSYIGSSVGQTILESLVFW